jgi:hypothetical protein
VVRNFIGTISAVSILFLVFFLTSNNNNEPKQVKTEIQSDCLLEKKSCRIMLPNSQEFIFNIEPKVIPAMELFTLSIERLGKEPKAFKVWLEGKDMNMGSHYMLPVPSAENLTEIQEFQGMIPVCSVDKNMIWLLKIEIPSDDQFFQIQFHLQTKLNT